MKQPKLTVIAPLMMVFSFLFNLNEARAYPSFIGYGYTSCIVCHFNAFGNGPLTDYGRALGATAISAKPFYSPNISDEKLGEQSGFLGSVEFPDWLRFQAGYRGLIYASQIGKGTTSDFVNMQADLSVTVKGLDDKLIATVTAGYAPPAQGAPAGTPRANKIISREHYISYLYNGRHPVRFYAGFMDVPFGIRTPDHIAYSRSLTKLAQNDQVHGVAAHWGFNDMELGAMLFLGNLYQNSKVRPIGGSMIFEYDAAEKVRVGASVLLSTSSVRNRNLFALHMRAGVGEGSSALFELGFVKDSPQKQPSTLGSYFYTQTMVRMLRGLHVLFTGEYKTADTFRPSLRTFRVGPAVQYFPMQRLELRADFLGSRTLGSTEPYEPSDDFMAMAQVHLWF